MNHTDINMITNKNSILLNPYEINSDVDDIDWNNFNEIIRDIDIITEKEEREILEIEQLDDNNVINDYLKSLNNDNILDLLSKKQDGLDLLYDACKYVELKTNINYSYGYCNRSNSNYWMPCTFVDKISKFELSSNKIPQLFQKQENNIKTPLLQKPLQNHTCSFNPPVVIMAKYANQQYNYWPARLATDEEIKISIEKLQPEQKKRVKLNKWENCNKPDDKVAVIFLGVKELCLVKFKNCDLMSNHIDNLEKERKLFKPEVRAIFDYGIETAHGLLLRKSNEKYVNQCHKCFQPFAIFKKLKRSRSNFENLDENQCNQDIITSNDHGIKELRKITCAFCNISTHLSCFSNKEKDYHIKRIESDELNQSSSYICQICKYRFPLSCKSYFDEQNQFIQNPKQKSLFIQQELSD